MQDNADRNFFVVVLIFSGINITDSVYPELVHSLAELYPTIGDIFSEGLVEVAPLLASSNKTQCSVSGGIRTVLQKTDEVGDNTCEGPSSD